MYIYIQYIYSRLRDYRRWACRPWKTVLTPMKGQPCGVLAAARWPPSRGASSTDPLVARPKLTLPGARQAQPSPWKQPASPYEAIDFDAFLSNWEETTTMTNFLLVQTNMATNGRLAGRAASQWLGDSWAAAARSTAVFLSPYPIRR